MYKVLFHLNDPEKTGDALRNMENLIQDIKAKNLRIKLVVHSQGVLAFTRSGNPDIDKINKLIENNVEINICSNTMKSLNLKEEDFPFKISIVSSAVGELVRYQEDGWLYIKP